MCESEASILELLQHNPKRVRNICILAHVDHGKTTLADSLVASNGIISQRMAGQLRYMDNRKDEQERGITMKSSGISLHFKGGTSQLDYLINLIDSPGHVDFSSEVSTAVRLCDGAILVVDVVEGVCAQTRACLQQVYVEQLKPVLVLNKIDRLILEKKMTPSDAYFHITQVLEQVNAVLGAIFASDILAKEDITTKNNYESALEDVDDSNLYFQPSNGNVVFACAADGWAFSINDFAKIYSTMLEIPIDKLEVALWGDYYYNSKKKCATLGAQVKAKKPMFVQFVLENIWTLYDIIAVRKDKTRLPVIAEKLNIKLSPRDLRITDTKIQIRTVMGQWLPIDRCVLELVVCHVPPPDTITIERAQRLLFPSNVKLESYPSETLHLLEDFRLCSAQSEKVIVYVAKMIAVHESQLPKKKLLPSNEQDLQARRDEIRQRVKERQLEKEISQIMDNVKQLEIQDNGQEDNNQAEHKNLEHVFIGFGRIFSGKLKAGDKLYLLEPKHDPRKPEHLKSDAPYVTEVTIESLYMFMGGELQVLNEAVAGNFVGIGGLANSVVKTATLCNSYYCTSFSELSIMATPIYRVAIEPVNPLQMPQLIKGLKLLNQADACVQISVSPTGERIISTLGEVHVEKCVRDLEDNYAGIKVTVSEPIVPFRETIVTEATTDMVNETIVKSVSDRDISKKVVEVQTTNKLGQLRILALPLPTSVVQLLERYTNNFKMISQASTAGVSLSDKEMAIFTKAKLQMRAAFKEFDVKLLPIVEQINADQLVERIWALGPRHCGSNILLNLSDFKHINYWNENSREALTDIDIRRDYANSLVNGFQVTAAAGPLCEEPMHGVCFVVLEWKVNTEKELNTKAFGPFSGQVLNAAKDACRLAFQQQPMRLVSPMYSCSITVDGEMLGKMYAVISRRHGKIISGDMTLGSGKYTVEAVLPVIESFNFAQEIRKQTSGLACPQLVFSHWEIIDIDPFWVPTTEEEITHYGEKADSANRGKVYMDSVRRRKGLHVNEQVVEFAEKQRTLSKNK